MLRSRTITQLLCGLSTLPGPLTPFYTNIATLPWDQPSSTSSPGWALGCCGGDFWDGGEIGGNEKMKLWISAILSLLLLGTGCAPLQRCPRTGGT